jgi:diadenylate cyclase
MDILNIIESIGISGFLDILCMSVIIYSLLVWLKRTKAAFAVMGMFIFGAAYLLARQLDLSLTIIVFQGFFAIILIAVVIIFQEEIKHFLEQLASRSLVTNFRLRKVFGAPRKETELLVNVARNFSREKTGAIIVIRGRDPIERHIEGGVQLNGEMSEALLGSIFMPKSPGHDGAVVIVGNQVTAFSCYLPLSKNLKKLPKAGTRHAAALGLAELTDALCLVISEERGTISVARNGEMKIVKDPVELMSILEGFYREITPSGEKKSWLSFFSRNYREKVIAVVVTCVLWFFFVHEARVDFRTYVVPLTFENLPPTLVVEEADPAEVEITYSGARRSFYFVDAKRISAEVNMFGVHAGAYRRTISRSDISTPEGLSIENIQPNQVVVHVKKAPKNQ